MQTRIPKQALMLLTLVLMLGNAGVAALLVQETGPEELKVSFLDVGQGDAILIEGPTGIELLVDGGRDRSVLRELPRVMGPLDRSIDMVLATHPDADHIGGLPDVLSRYRVSTRFVCRQARPNRQMQINLKRNPIPTGLGPTQKNNKEN